MKIQRIVGAGFLAMALLCVSTLRADVVEDVRALMDSGNYQESLDMVLSELQNNPQSEQAGALNALAGEILILDGRQSEALPYLEKAMAKGVADAYLSSGRLALRSYDFPKASEMYGKYFSLKEKASKTPSDDARREKEGIEAAESMFERVENITIIDRIDVDANDFFTHYKLSPESGVLLSDEVIGSDYPELASEAQFYSPVFQNERGNFRLWAQSDTTNDNRIYIVESNRFVDGGWEKPQNKNNVLNGGGDAAFPFMMADGVTLYFASNGDGTIGGYDIFRSNRDAATAEYKSPVNMGMPYNSPYNDYMLAIDESTGVGWWASDRNQLPDNKISIYMFIPNEFRKNYTTDNPNLKSLALLNDISLAQPEEAVETIDSLRKAIADIKPAEITADPEFDFMIAPGVVYHNLDDFTSEKAAGLMSQWMEKTQKFEVQKEQLKELRTQFSDNKSDASLRSQILSIEKRVEKDRKSLDKLRGEIVKAEKEALK